MRLLSGLELERRADSSYTDALIAAITANAGGQSSAYPTATSALESCAGLVGRAFASAEIKAPDYAIEALGPDTLSMIGRALIRKGEILFDIDVSEGQVQLMPASSYDVDGDPDPRTWRYRLNLGGPDLQITRENLGGDSVVHLQYAKDPETPWRGVGPLQVAQLAGRLSAETSAALADEASGPRGSFLPMPTKDGKDTTTTALKGDIRTAKGSMLTVESMSANWNAGQDAPKGDWQQMRFGPMPPDALVKLLGAASVEVMSACGLSADLWLPGGRHWKKRGLATGFARRYRTARAARGKRVKTEAGLSRTLYHMAGTHGERFAGPRSGVSVDDKRRHGNHQGGGIVRLANARGSVTNAKP